jgi:hypothetical protein
MRRRAEIIELQPWSYDDRPRVLIEHRDPDEALEMAAALRKAGLTVGICRGPEAQGAHPTRCPLHQLEPCVAVEGADVVVTALDLDEEEGMRVLEGLRVRYPSTALVVAVTPQQALDHGALLRDCIVVPADAEPTRVVRAVLQTLDR